MYHDPEAFPFVRRFLDRWDEIKREYAALPRKVIDLHRTGHHHEYVEQLARNNGWTPSWQVGSTVPNNNWLTYGLSFGGAFPLEAAERFPVSMDVIRQCPGLRVCAFSLMKPHSFIAPHRHPELGGDLLTFHLGLDVDPGRSFLCVGGQFEEEKEEKPIVFDGSVDHFAINMSKSERAIFYAEFDRSVN